jgi:hypothetical protein
MGRKYEYGYKGDKRYFDSKNYMLYPRRCEIIGETLVVYDMEFNGRVCHVFEMKYLSDNVETSGQNVTVLCHNCDQATVSSTTSARGANFLAEVISKEIKKVHQKYYGEQRKSSDIIGGEGCCGSLDGGEMAEMSLASCEPGPGI